MLNGVLSLHDVRDVEAFCTRIIQRSRIQLTPAEHEDLLAYLIEEAWKLSTRYRTGGISFSTWAGTTLRKRVTCWDRANRIDTRYPSNTRYTQVSYDAELDNAHGHVKGNGAYDYPTHRLAQAIAVSPLDDHAHSRADQQRLHHHRDRTNDRPYPDMGRTPTRTAA